MATKWLQSFQRLSVKREMCGICIKDIDKVNLSILKESLKQNIR